MSAGLEPRSAELGSIPLVQAPEGLSLGALLRLAGILVVSALAVLGVWVAKRPLHVLHWWSRAVLRCLRIQLQVEGPLPLWPQLWTSNHMSWLDPLVLMSIRPMGAVAKEDVARYPLIGTAARRAGLLFVDRSDAASRAAVALRLARELRKGAPMLLFPEGTTTRGHGLAPLYEGGLRAAFRSRCSALPLRLVCGDPRYPWVGDAGLVPSLLAMAGGSPIHIQIQAQDVLSPWQCQDEAAWVSEIRTRLEERTL